MINVTPRLMAYNVREPLGGAGKSRVDQFIAAAMKFEGQPYKWGGGHTSSTFSKPGPVDCSGLVMQAARMAGLNFDGTAETQQDKGKPVGMNELKTGDLVFRGNPAYHVGIYLGNGKVLHAPKTGDVVRVTTVDGWQNARRVFDENDRADSNQPASNSGAERPSGNDKPSQNDRPRPKPSDNADRFEPSAALQARTAPPQPGPSYLPQPGETLLAIAERTLGDQDRWMDIYQLNRHVMPSPYVLYPGQPITLPAGAKVDAAPAAPAAAPQAAAPTANVVAAAPATVGTFQNVQSFLGATKDKLAQVMAGMAMA